MGWEDDEGRQANAGGKRIRPLLCLFAARALGAGADDAMAAAVAVELIHNFSLVHDDVQDRDAERHGRPTAWKLHGEAQAINLGDFLYTKAVAALAGAPGPADRRMAALGVLLQATGRMIEGQWLDISFETRDSVTEDEYLGMVAGKTGALLGAPLAMGAILAGAPPGHAPALARWGEHVGIAFQAHDDYLGAWGDPNLTGKSASNDIARKKKSLPVVLGLQDGTAAEVIRSVYALPDVPPEGVAEVLRALERASIDQACTAIARQHAEEAAALLDSLPLAGDAKGQFGEIAAYLVARSA